MVEQKESWSKGGNIYFLDGFGWGIAPNRQTIAMPKQEVVEDAIKNKTKLGNPLWDSIIQMEVEDINEYNGQDMVGASNTGTSRGKQKTARRTTAHKKLALRTSKSKY